jgi:HEAT repeat protein
MLRGWILNVLTPLRIVGFLCLALLAIVPTRVHAQFMNQFQGDNPGGGTGSRLSGDRARDRQSRSRKGMNVQEWVRRLKNDNPDTRLEAVKSLGDSKDPKAIEPLVNATADTDIRVKVKAINYLGNLKATDATPVLVQQLFLREVGPGIKQKVLVALGKIGDPRGAAPIVEFLKRNLDSQTKGTALYALREVGNDSVLPFLENFSRVEQSPPLRRLAAEAAENIRHRLSPEFSPVVPTFIKQVELRNKAEKGEEEEKQ